ncbi:MAG: hypothetical protein LBB23_02465 [Rickettsiales bacterium]|jgi:hypothetical protein|nr:hypothetical protein [Rickettsiales bacterium]
MKNAWKIFGGSVFAMLCTGGDARAYWWKNTQVGFAMNDVLACKDSDNINDMRACLNFDVAKNKSRSDCFAYGGCPATCCTYY